MSIRNVRSFLTNKWIEPDSSATEIFSAPTGKSIARAGNSSLDSIEVLNFARSIGGPALRKLTFHDRARMLKAIAMHLNEHRKPLYDLSFNTGATQADNQIDIDGGIGTMFVFASKGRRELPDNQIYSDGNVEQISKTGTFLGQHICTPLRGVALHINAFNFPVWGMLEKLSPTLLAGVPAIVKPATASCYVAEYCVQLIIDSGILPDGALQLVSGNIGDMLNHLDSQDIVSFTGSAETATKLSSAPNITGKSIRFISEQDSLNASILGPDAEPNTPEFDLFIKEVQREITTKAGQKCTAIRRILVQDDRIESVIESLSARLAKTSIGDPRLETTRMGSLISERQKKDVLEKANAIASESERVFGDPENFTIEGESVSNGAFLPPMLFHCKSPDTAKIVHETEAFGPISTILGYEDIDHAIELTNKGQGSLVTSIFTYDNEVARTAAVELGAYNGRLYFNNRDSMNESTGHGSPLPHLVHGGPGRAGGGEELGGVRGVMHYMQRTAIQGSPDFLTKITGNWVSGSKKVEQPVHPFYRNFNELVIGESIQTSERKITLEDIEHFANFTGDTFYAHMDEEAAKNNPFFSGRVAHGYLVLSFAAGLFVKPEPGPVLANVGLDNLRFLKPVEIDDSISVRLTVKRKTKRNDEYGEVRWDVAVFNQNSETVAEYELLTMNAI